MLSSQLTYTDVGRSWFTTHTYGPKSKRTHHLSAWSTSVESSPNVTLITPDLDLFLTQWEVGVPAYKAMRYPER